MKTFCLFIGFILLTVAGFAQQNEAELVISRLYHAFETKDATGIKSDLSPDFSVGTYMGGPAIFSLEQIVDKYKVQSLTAGKVVNKDTLLMVPVTMSGAADKETKVYLTKDFKIQRVDLFDKLYGLDRNATSEKVATIPFEEDNGSIILVLTLNENTRKLRFLFDTGSDGMMVSTALADELGLKISREQNASAVGGHIEIKVSENNTVHLNDFKLDHQSIAIFGNTNPAHDGIIGNTIAKRYITHIDYGKKQMTLYSLGKFNHESKNAQKIPVDISTGNILFPATLNLQKDKLVPGKFTFDTGAGFHMIVFRPTVLKYKMLVDGFEPDSVGSTVSMGMATPVFHGKAQKLSFSNKWAISNFPVTLMGKSETTSGWNPGADGSLGIRFISDYNFTINLVDRYISFEKRS